RGEIAGEVEEVREGTAYLARRERLAPPERQHDRGPGLVGVAGVGITQGCACQRDERRKGVPALGHHRCADRAGGSSHSGRIADPLAPGLSTASYPRTTLRAAKTNVIKKSTLLNRP